MSLICQFNIKYIPGIVNYIVTKMEEMFSCFGYDIKKIWLSTKAKILSPNYKKFKSLLDIEMFQFEDLSFQSDFNSHDFEPNARCYTYLNNRYIHSKSIIKLSVIINDKNIIIDFFDVYKKMICILSENSECYLSGYSFLISNYYGAVSFATGILRRMNMSRSLKNLAGWYSSSDIENGTICLLNCFSNLNESQNHYLENVFGEENFFKSNGISAFYNRFAEGVDISDYLISSNYNLICNSIEERVPFKRLHFYKEI